MLLPSKSKLEETFSCFKSLEEETPTRCLYFYEETSKIQVVYRPKRREDLNQNLQRKAKLKENLQRKEKLKENQNLCQVVKSKKAFRKFRTDLEHSHQIIWDNHWRGNL